MNISFYIASLRWRPPKLIMQDEEAIITGLSAFVCCVRNDQYRTVALKHKAEFFFFLVTDDIS